jgi:hypothetical protein
MYIFLISLICAIFTSFDECNMFGKECQLWSSSWNFLQPPVTSFLLCATILPSTCL